MLWVDGLEAVGVFPCALTRPQWPASKLKSVPMTSNEARWRGNGMATRRRSVSALTLAFAVIAALSALALVSQGARATLVSAKTCDGGSIALDAGEKRMLELHNKARTRRGLKPLCVHPALTASGARSLAGDNQEGLPLPSILRPSTARTSRSAWSGSVTPPTVAPITFTARTSGGLRVLRHIGRGIQAVDEQLGPQEHHIPQEVARGSRGSSKGNLQDLYPGRDIHGGLRRSAALIWGPPVRYWIGARC